MIDNTDIHNLRVLYNNSLDSYYKEIGPTDLFDLTITNKTQYTNYEKPEDFASSPAKYKAVAYCFCGFIDKDKISPGNHQVIIQRLKDLEDWIKQKDGIMNQK